VSANGQLLTAEQLSELLQVHPKTIYLLARQGRIPRIAVSRAIRFDLVAVLEALNKQEKERLERRG
jgi:excisionase family DNA binding protein